MTIQLIISAAFGVAGIAALAIAVVHERRMQAHRRDGVTYSDVTLRRDGGWRRDDLFAPEGLVHQRQASRFGVAGAVLLLAGVIAWIVLGAR
jgi:hypothetical protein